MKRINRNILKQIVERLYGYSNYYVFLLTIICLYAIIQIKLECAFWIGRSDKADSINDILLNLAYSYLAALIFYIFTSVFPYLSMRYRCKNALREKVRLIVSNYKACAESVVPFPQNLPNNISKECLIEIFQGKSYMDLCRLHILGLKIPVIEYIRVKHKENMVIASEILDYKTWLSSDMIVNVEIIRNSQLTAIINSLTAPSLKDSMAEDKQCRKMLAEAVFELWSISKQLNA